MDAFTDKHACRMHVGATECSDGNGQPGKESGQKPGLDTYLNPLAIHLLRKETLAFTTTPFTQHLLAILMASQLPNKVLAGTPLTLPNSGHPR